MIRTLNASIVGRLVFLIFGCLILPLWGCATGPRIATAADRYRLELVLDPESHGLKGRALMDMVRVGTEPVGDQSAVVAFRLHPALRVIRVRAAGATVVRHWIERDTVAEIESEGSGGFSPALHLVLLDRPHNEFTMTVDYQGSVVQDVSAGERPGEIHNFEMRAHVGPEGIYLANGAWYPEPVGDDNAPPRPADFALLAAHVPGMTLAVGAEHDQTSVAQSGYTSWRSPYPLDGLVVVGGPHEVHFTTHRDVGISVHLKPEQAPFAAGLLDAVKRNLDRYEPLLGPYPAREYKIVDNFFSSGFAFPTMTLLSSAVIEMGERSQTTHGYLDHEMLHCWWGNGVLVDPRDGNWCESLTSYASNYYGYVLDGQFDEARRKRRNYSHFLSRLTPEQDQPLGTFGLPGGCGREVAYVKGAAVFHMLAREIGQENFWAAMRSFDSEFLGRYADWSDIQRTCEAAGGHDLGRFFDQWVRRGGAPLLRIDAAAYNSADELLLLSISQPMPIFDVNVPVRVVTASGINDLSIKVDSEHTNVSLPVTGVPLTVELDPDYEVFRRVPEDEITPTTATTRRGSALTTVVSDSDVPSAYAQVRSIFASSYKPEQHAAKAVGELEEGDLADRCVLILGDAVRTPYVSGFLEAIQFPVHWTETGFELSGVAYDDPSDAVLCTVRHPGVPGGGVTVLFANSEAAIPRAFAVPMYEHSLVIFDGGRPSVRLDFEPRSIVTVARG